MYQLSEKWMSGGWIDIQNSNQCNIPYYRMKKKTHDHLDWQIKSIWQNSKAFHDKNKVGIGENFLQMIIAIYEKSTVNIIPNGEEL